MKTEKLLITVTGADDKTSIEEMVNLSKNYPLLEFAILLKEGDPKERYPSKEWIARLYDVWCQNESMILSGHICGRWVREICEGNWNPVFEYLGDMTEMFSRIQLNFSPYTKDIKIDKFLKGMESETLYFKQIIFQLKNINDPVFIAAKNDDFNVVPLFDLSGGRGISPDSWPISDCLCGYAGGLSPENVQDQIRAISKVASQFWIDAETGLRTNGEFDLAKVESFHDKACRGFLVEKGSNA